MTIEAEEPNRVSYSEDVTSLDGFAATAEEVIDGYGGTITARDDESLRFRLPRRRGDESAGALDCRLEWGSREAGRVRVTADGEIEGPRAGRIALLLIGSAGALAFIFWPFFPAMGPAAGVGMVLAIAVYMLTLRRSPHGLVGNLLREIVAEQEERLAGSKS